MTARRLIPIIDGPWWDIGPKPDLGASLPAINETYGDEDPFKRNEPNDHHVFRAKDGTWQLWACVRRTPVGRLLVNWEADELTQSPWRLTGRLIRADRAAGESRVDWCGQEFLQSPFGVRHEGRWYLFYGGYATGHDPDGRPTDDYSLMENQVSLMLSDDGKQWERYRGPGGLSRVFEGPGAVRDQCIVRLGGTWYAYYAGHHDRDRRQGAIYGRTSRDLIHWSDWTIVEFNRADGETYLAESPAVVERGGAYYLFRTHGPRRGTYVFRSDDPLDFGRGVTSEESPHFVCRLDVIAPEIVADGASSEYITRIDHERDGYGIRMARLRWQEA